METYRFKVGILRLKWCKHLYRLVTATSLHLAFVEGCNRVIVLEFNQQDVLGPTRWSVLLGFTASYLEPQSRVGYMSNNLSFTSFLQYFLIADLESVSLFFI